MKTIKAYRHGDLCLVPVKSLPTSLTKADTNVLMTGSHGNDHKVVNGEVYFKNENKFVFGYLKAKKGAKLLHVDHGDKKAGAFRECSIPEGCYQLRKQFEDTHQGMIQIVD